MMSRVRSAIRTRRHDDRGIVAGSDMLIFGTVAFVLGSLLIMNVWAVIDSSLAVSAAAREGARAFAETGDDVGTARSAASASAQQVMSDYGKTNSPVVVTASSPDYGRCAFVTVTVEYDVALVSLPLFGDLGDRTASSSHSTRVDAWRSGDFGEFDGVCP